jgi:hypothetical protein
VVKKRYFETEEECEVSFELTREEAGHVSLVSEWTGWQPVEMTRTGDGLFRTTLRLPRRRRFQFRYLVDHTNWINDDSADDYAPNEFGGQNGVIDTA